MSKTFRNLKELERYLKSSEGTGVVVNDAQIRSNLTSEMNRLQKYLIDEMNNHYSSYSPQQYERTGAWLESITVNPIQKIGNAYTISLTFDDNFAYHPSIIGGEDGYVPWLMEVGWKDKTYQTPHFDGFKGTHYIKNAVEKWNKTNRFGFSISVFRGNERYI